LRWKLRRITGRRIARPSDVFAAAPAIDRPAE
jgi:hypothetical protein